MHLGGLFDQRLVLLGHLADMPGRVFDGPVESAVGLFDPFVVDF